MEDSLLLYLSSLVCLIESVVITTSFSMSKGIKLLGFFLLYSIPLYYLLFTRSSGVLDSFGGFIYYVLIPYTYYYYCFI